VRRRSPWHIAPDPADILHHNGVPALTGAQVARAFGLLATYTTADRLPVFLAAGAIGNPRWGCWLTPTIYPACMAPPDLGMNYPADFCIVVDVDGLPEVWGPGTSRPSGGFPNTWKGGAIEFFVPQPIHVGLIRAVHPLQPCGDGHR
jgi:hypothetical protein